MHERHTNQFTKYTANLKFLQKGGDIEKIWRSEQFENTLLHRALFFNAKISGQKKDEVLLIIESIKKAAETGLCNDCQEKLSPQNKELTVERRIKEFLNEQDKNGYTALLSSVTRAYKFQDKYNEYKEIVSLLLEAGANPNIAAENFLYPLHVAASNLDVRMTDILCKKEVKIGVTDKDGYTPLHTAIINCKEKYDKTIECLLKEGSNPNIATKKCISPLQTAVAFLNVKAVRILLEGGADPNHTDKGDRSALHFAINTMLEHPNNYKEIREIIELILNNKILKIEINKKNYDGFTPLQSVIAGNTQVSERIEIVKKFLNQQETDVNLQDQNGNTPIISAIRSHDEVNGKKIVELLLKHEACPNMQNYDGYGTLHACIIKEGDKTEIIELLLKFGAKVDQTTGNKSNTNTALAMAVKHGHIKQTQCLLKHAANPLKIIYASIDGKHKYSVLDSANHLFRLFTKLADQFSIYEKQNIIGKDIQSLVVDTNGHPIHLLSARLSQMFEDQKSYDIYSVIQKVNNRLGIQRQIKDLIKRSIQQQKPGNVLNIPPQELE
ncbi:MAG: hypothetical protein sL5_10870 [Candidatus Mesenet longicola]|uniref:Ankyrin repeat domain-containing protein n=1 Tax=Candidatus Mesenet longicola TaxID=1892558 RepID=A0A8J3MMM6_9RICK|nr:MAG: hypothetical protein sGL2_11210 [Candidatus Mesenet longicola]GHM60094.1 MAG: hypothetical protein sL5_10870 [Candidatus Mesenet longicola]